MVNYADSILLMDHLAGCTAVVCYVMFVVISNIGSTNIC